jgi:hypothetical protein
MNLLSKWILRVFNKYWKEKATENLIMRNKYIRVRVYGMSMKRVVFHVES